MGQVAPGQVRLARTTHPLAVPSRDIGRAAPDLRMERILLLLKGTAARQAALDRLLADQQDPGSPRYHQWLTPDEFGRQFGASDADLDAVSAWLQSHDLQVDRISRGRTTIEFSGSARQVESAFRTEMRRYAANGATRLANASDIAIPDALAGVIGGVVSLHGFPRQPLHHVTQQTIPQQTIGASHFLMPYDFATIYNVAALWNNGYDGAGQTIAIAGRSNIRISDVSTFRSQAGLPVKDVQVVLNGPDPGILAGDEEIEAALDVEWSGAVARGATVKLVVSKSTVTTDGIDLSSQYIVDNNLASVVSVSFGSCEADTGPVSNQFYNTIWAQAAAQGISVFVASGDSGSAGCDRPLTIGANGANTTLPASRGFGVNGLSSTPHNVAVGGTQFDDRVSPSTWWNSSNDSNQASAKGYIPELVWNESSYAPRAPGNGLWSGGGGASEIYPTPSWQTGNGVPAADPFAPGQHHRYLPDVSLSGAGHVGYRVYQQGRFLTVGGTSAGSPAMAGIMALVNQFTGTRNGNPNPRFYALAAKMPSLYHDVTGGTNAVPCASGSPDCSAGLMTGYSATPGFDLATGWGSVDAHLLAMNWVLPGPATRLSVSTPASAVAGVPFNVTVTALDSLNQTAALYGGTVRFSSSDSAATLPAASPLSGGKGTFAATLKTAGSGTITATDSLNSSIAGTSGLIAVSALPDLTIASFSTASIGTPGGTLTANVTILNQGSGNAGAFVVRFYFQSVPGGSAGALDSQSSCAVAGLAAGASTVCTATVPVPLALPPGTWYLSALADAAALVVESNENNNSRVADSGAVTLLSRPPAAVSAAPASGSGAAQTFTFSFSDLDGRQDLDVVNVLINNFLDGRNACFVAYVRASNTLFLVADNGAGLSAGLLLNGQGSVSNSQCLVNGAGSSAGGSGNALTLTLSLTFSAAFAGNRILHLAARDIVQNNSDWQALGVWNVPGAVTFPAVDGVSPARGSGTSQTFTFAFADNKGFQDLGVVNILINQTLDGRHGCYLAYSRPLNTLYLVNDTGTGTLPGLVLNGSGSVGNSQCTLTGVGSSASGSGNTLTLTLQIGFSGVFGGNRVIYVAARDVTEASNSGWQALGTWTVQ